MAIGLSTQGIKMTYTAGSVTDGILSGLQEIPALGGKPSKIDVTCLEDSVKKNIFGVKDLGDLAFKFVYDNGVEGNFRTLKGLADEKTLTSFAIEFPDETKFTFSAYVNVETDSAAVDKALGFTATLALQSEIAVVNPS